MLAVKRAFSRGSGSAAPAPPPKPSATLGGLEILFRTRLDECLVDVVHSPERGVLAAATADGAIAIVDATDGQVKVVAELDEEEPPNAMAFTPEFLLHCGEDGCVRLVAVDNGTVVHSHSMTEAAEEGKRPRCRAVDGVVPLDGAFVAAAGCLVHACRVHAAAPFCELEHVLRAEAHVDAICAAPAREATRWSYAFALKGGVRLVSRQGQPVCELRTGSMIRSLGVFEHWLAAATYDGAVLLWDLEASFFPGAQAAPTVTLRSFCGSDGKELCWNTEGGGAIAVSGSRAAVFDFTGQNVPHPYRNKYGVAPWTPRRGHPDPVPRVCMHSAPGGVQSVAWEPRRQGAGQAEGSAEGMSPRLATLDKQGAVRVWQPLSLPLRKGGNGNPSQPQLMKPQFYTFPRQDAAHPTGESVDACALLWLREGVVAVGYSTGELIAWRVAA